MEFGVVREVTPQERRVGVTPEGARALVAAGHLVVVESGAGLGSGFSDTEYLAAGAELAWSPRDVGNRCRALIKVHAPRLEELELIRDDQILVGFLHLAAANSTLHERIRSVGVSTLSLELVREDHDEYPILEPTSALGGRVAVTLAAYHLTIRGGGPGLVLGGTAGVPPANVLVIGGGTAGLAAASEAMALGAQVVVLDRDPRRLLRIERDLGRGAVTATASEYHLSRYLEVADVVIGAVALKNEPTPRVLRRQHIRLMREGSLFMDLSIDSGGCSETSRATTMDAPVYEEEGVRHVCIPNLASEVSRTASRLLAACLLPYLFLVAEGVEPALRRSEALRGACSYFRGQLVNRSLARFVRGPLVDLDSLVPREGQLV